MKNQHVIIAGAGPAGLTLGLVLQQKNIKFTIVDAVSKDKLCADVGGGYDLGANAFKVFRQFDLTEAVKNRGARFDVIRVYSDKGKLTSSINIPDSVDMASIKRSTLQNILLEKLTTSNIRFGSRIVDVIESEGSVSIALDNGNEISGNLLVGADGVHSAVRYSVLADGEPRHVGVNCVWGRTNWSMLSASSRNQFDGGYMMLGNGQAFLAGHMGDQLIWSTFSNANSFIASGNRYAARKKAIDRLTPWNDQIAEIVRLSDEITISESGIYDRPAARTWHSQRTILIGDAAHPMTPFLGAGANTAITDAFVLGQLIDGLHSADEIFRFFEQRRKKSVEKIVTSARIACDYSLSEKKWKNMLMLYSMSLIPSFLIAKMLLASDKVNDVSFL